MTTGATTLLSLSLPVEGELDGTWGDVVNYGITNYVDIAVAGTLTFTGDGAITLANTVGDGSGTNISSTTAQYAIIKVTGTLTATKVITAPSTSKTYIVDNATATFGVTFKASGQTGVTVAAGEKCSVYYNGTDYVKVASSVVDGVSTISFGSTGLTPATATSGAVTVAGTLAVLSGGTGVTTSTGTGNVVLSTSPTLVTPALGTPSSATLTNATGLPISTGVSGLGTGVATFLATPSSANLAATVTDETGSGSLVFATSPTLVTPALGTPSSVTLTNATGLPISTGVSGLGTGVATALAVNVGTAGAPVVNGGVLGTPSSGTLTNATGLPISTGVSGLGTGVATALAVNVGSAGAPVVNGGVLGTPSSGTATNLTGLPISTGVSGLGTGVATALAVNVGSAGAPVVNGGVLGTPSSGTATNLTGLPLTTGVTGTLPVANGGTGVTTSTGTGSTVLSASPALTGIPTVPTAGNGTNTTQAASTAFVINQIGAIAAGVSSFSAGTTGLTPSLATSGAVTLAGTLAVANGGTGVTTSTGSGNNVLSTSPTLVTPVLGTPQSGNLANCTFPTLNQNTTGTAAGLSATLAVASGGTGVTTSTGSGSVVLSTSPTLTTPILGTPQSATLTNATGLPLTTGVTGTLPVANGGTGTATPSLVQGSNITITGAWPNQTIAATASTSGQYQATASGTIANGSLIVVNANGTVSAINSNNQSAGSAATFVSGDIFYTSAAYDAANNRVVVAYAQSSFYGSIGQAVVGTVSGSSISWGTPVTFNSATTAFTSIVFDSTNNRVVVAYRNDTASTGEAIVGTVSGTSISFGTAVTFNGASNVSYPSAVFDTTNSKVVIAYSDIGNSFYGTAIVGTVSGTSISFGTKVVISAATVMGSFSGAFDSTNGKVVYAYRGPASTYAGYAVVGTVSGTSISFGTPVLMDSLTSDYMATVFDSVNGKIVVAYQTETGGGPPYAGKAIVGTVSGTSISFGTAVTFKAAYVGILSAAYSSYANRVVITWTDQSNSSYGTSIVGLVSTTTITFGSSSAYNSATVVYPTAVYDSTSQKVVVAYRDNPAGAGRGQVLTVGFTNLSATNYIGISNAAYANGATATIQTVGSVDDAQSGLTPGLAYYVQNDGTLSTTAGSPSVFAGTAVAATKILVKG